MPRENENSFLTWLQDAIGAHAELAVGIGDDAALVEWSHDAECVFASDMIAEGIHFPLDTDPSLVGRKAVAVNLSDMAAMAARPVAVCISLLVQQNKGIATARAVLEGANALARQYNVAIAGGDTNSWPGPMVVNVSVVGKLEGREPVLRSGARPGDAILVTGTLGGSLLGKHLEFEPRVDEMLSLIQETKINAAMDISDGLTVDLRRMTRASKCGADVELSAIPISAAARQLAAQDGNKSPLDHALSDGEDFELLLAVDASAADQLLQQQPLAVPLTRIGSFTSTDQVRGIEQDGSARPLPADGYVHPL